MKKLWCFCVCSCCRQSCCRRWGFGRRPRPSLCVCQGVDTARFV